MHFGHGISAPCKEGALINTNLMKEEEKSGYRDEGTGLRILKICEIGQGAGEKAEAPL